MNLVPIRTALVIVECQGGTVGADSALPDLGAAAAPALPVIGPSRRPPARQARLVHLTYVPAFCGSSPSRRPTM
jgi:hypothetical protein